MLSRLTNSLLTLAIIATQFWLTPNFVVAGSRAFASTQQNAPPQEHVTVHGLVSDEAGNPIADADVCMLDPHERGKPISETKTNSQGEYSLDAPRIGDQFGIAVAKKGFAISYVVSGESRNRWYPLDYFAAIKPNTAIFEMNHKLQKPLPISIRFLDSNNSPLPVESSQIDYVGIGGIGFRNNAHETFAAEVHDNEISIGILGKGDSFNLIFALKHNEKFNTQTKGKTWITVDNMPNEPVEAVVSSNHSVVGTLRDANGSPIENVKVVAFCSQQIQKGSISLSLNFETKTNKEGRYEFQSLPSGNATLQIENSRLILNNKPEAQKLEPDESIVCDLVAVSACRVFGRVVDSDGDPIPNIKFNLMQNGGAAIEEIQSDMNGEFSGWARGTPSFLNLDKSSIPVGWLEPYDAQLGFRLEPGQTEHEMADIVLEKADPVVGTVIDLDGNPVPNAYVKSVWTKSNGKTFTASHDTAIADDEGNFVLAKTSRMFDVGITACTDILASDSMLLLTKQEDRSSLKLTVGPKGVIQLKGRTVDANSKPIPNVAIQVKQALQVPDGHIYGEYPVFQDRQCLSDENGNYAFPVRLLRTGSYSISAHAQGYQSAESTTLKIEDGSDVLAAPTLVLTRTYSANGIVLDTKGTPVGGALIQAFSVRPRGQPGDSEIKVLTTEDGTFQLDNIHPDCHFCFVSKQGFRFRGTPIQFVDSAGSNFIIELASDSEPSRQTPLAMFKTDETHRKQMALKLIESQMSVNKQPYSRYFLSTCFDFLIRSDREQAIKFAKDSPLSATKSSMLFQLQNIDEAMELANALATANERANAMSRNAEHILDVEIRKQVLMEAALHNAAILNIESRVQSLAGIIEQLSKCGDFESARPLAELGIDMAWGIGEEGRGSYARGSLAKSAAKMFPEQSAKLIEAMTDKDSLNNYRAKLSQEIAGTDPSLAEELMEQVTSGGYHLPGMLFNMAGVDLERALRIARQNKPGTNTWLQRQNGLGAIAYSLKDSQPDLAKTILAEAVSKFVNHSDHRYSLGVGINLLRFSIEVAPEQSDEYFWKILQVYADPNPTSWQADDALSEYQIGLARQCILLAFFDRHLEIREKILRPILGDFADLDSKDARWFGDAHDRAIIFVCLALTLPEETVEWQKRYTEMVPEEVARYLPQPWEVLAHSFTKSDKELFDYVASELEHDWVIGQSDD